MAPKIQTCLPLKRKCSSTMRLSVASCSVASVSATASAATAIATAVAAAIRPPPDYGDCNDNDGVSTELSSSRLAAVWRDTVV
ncbi:unnamed protein product [Soboliphyme baturini]|uniref:Secreted protein n=1 Tax=Soboliphyme baturini TaxID=241478 RepID=A0A183J3A8_9BILA|nr:unnamed protein product [Soboliphyme baturini]